MAQSRVAAAKVEYLQSSKTEGAELEGAIREAEALHALLDSVAEKRLTQGRSESKRRMPAEVITISEAHDLVRYERVLRQEAWEERSERVEVTIEPVQSAIKRRDFKQEEIRFEPPPARSNDQPSRMEVGQRREIADGEPEESRHGLPERERRAERINEGNAARLLDELSRIFGRELVGEAKLACTKFFANDQHQKSHQGRSQRMEKLSAAREEYQAVSEEAERGRAVLVGRGLASPGMALTPDEVSLLKVYFRHVPEGLRERIATEIGQARIFEDAEERPAQKVEAEQPSKIGAESQKDAFSSVLPGEAAGKLIVDLELTRARAVFLRSEERNFAAMPHRWVSPVNGMSLAGVEKQINVRLKQKKDLKDLTNLREQLQNELARERHRLPQKRAEAENEVSALNARVTQEVAIREAVGVPPPQGHFKEEHLHELMNKAEASRDTQLLERIYKIDREQAIGDAHAASDPEIIRQLEEKYAGLKLKAEVRLHQDESALAWAQNHSIEILLPARDGQGKDIAVSLEQYEPQKGLRGALGKLTEGHERREMRSRLEALKESYLGHRGSEVKAQTAYHRALQAIAKDRRELSRGYGYHTPAAPALPAEKIAEIRAYAVKHPEGIAKPWLKHCAQAQALLDSWTAQPYRARESADKTTSQSEGRGSAEKVQKELQELRQRQERMLPVPTRDVIPRESPIPVARERNDRDKTNRGGRGGR